MTHAISAAGLALIQEFEGFRAEPTPLPDGSFVVGFAHVRVGEPGAPMSREDAAQVLGLDLAPVECAVNEHVTPPLNQGQFDALVSFAFSVGVDAFAQSQVLRRVNKGEFVAAACAMDAWRKAEVDGEVEIVDALVRRRAAEKALFLKDMPHAAAPSVFMRAKLDHAAAILGAPIKYAPAPAVSTEAPPHADATPTQAECPVTNAAQRLTEILRSEPATEVLLLTQVAPQEGIDLEDEIITAHARPVARRVQALRSHMPVDRRIRSMRRRAAFLDRAKSIFSVSRTVENFGLMALMAFGLALTYIAGTMLFGANVDTIDVAGAAALATPGLAATMMSAYGLLRAPRAEVQAQSEPEATPLAA
ncbi:MAG: lysozyme [Hyphomonadaceae bacterium]